MDLNFLIFAIIGINLLIILTVLCLLIYSGLFHSVVVGAGKPPVQDLYVAYKFRKGPYSQISQMFTEICSLAPEQRAIAIYYDDPEQVMPNGGVFSVVVGAGKPPVQDLYVAYKFRKGPYSQISQMFTEICSLAPEQRAIAIYYDDPEQVPPEKLRYLVGCIMAEGAQRPDKDLAELLEKGGYKCTYFPVATNAVKTTFPFTTGLSIYIAINKVYPKLGSYIHEHKLCAHPIMEIYNRGLIHYMAPLAQQDEFYVPEMDENYTEEPEREAPSFIPEAKYPKPPELSQKISVSKQTTAERGQGDAPMSASSIPLQEQTEIPQKDATQPSISQENVEKRSEDTVKPAKENDKTGTVNISVDNQQAKDSMKDTEVAVPPGPVVTSNADQQDDKSSSSSFDEVPIDLDELK